MRRSDRTQQAFERAKSRLYEKDGEWFFRTREADRGPFDNRNDALDELIRYADTMGFIEENKGALPSEVDWNDVTMVKVQDSKPF